MATTDLDTLMSVDLPEGRGNLLDSYTNLERVAEYCETNYFSVENKRGALEETKGYTTQSLASVAYQINTLAYNFLQMLDLQGNAMTEMESQVNHIGQTIAIHKEKVARREIGILTTNKSVVRQYKIIAPSTPERPVKYVRKKIDYSILDDVGHGIVLTPTLLRTKIGGPLRQNNRPPSSSSCYGSIGNVSLVGPAPLTKPPTPPQNPRFPSSTGTLNRSKEYRTPPIVPPPVVPSNYAAGSRGSRGNGIALVHPLQQELGGTMPRLSSSSMKSSSSGGSTNYGGSSTLGRHPSSAAQYGRPFIGQSHPPMQQSQYGTMSRPTQRPPSPPSTKPHSIYGRKHSESSSIYSSRGGISSEGVLPLDPSLPGWVPKNYIDKVTAIYDYSANKEDELSFNEGSTIYVIKKNDDGWWEGVMDSITGLFPGNYVEPLSK